MIGRTHDLAAMTTLVAAASFFPVPPLRLSTILVAVGANLIGALAPDLDQPTAHLWYHIPAGSMIGRFIRPLLGGHRLISHSLLGLGLAGWLAQAVLTRASSVLLVNMEIVWQAFILGYISHLLVDSITKEGVPWFFPLPVRIGFPPLKSLRISTGGILEKFVVFPGLLLLNGYLIYHHYGQLLQILGHR